jgi:pimeloyl-ACP methyl ester carboxylesterase
VTRSPLHVDITGDGPDLVLLHGGAGGAADLAVLNELLSHGRRVIAPDQRAHGRSPDLGELTYAAMAADTADLLDELGVHGADVVGWSDGGVIALHVARDRPELVGRVTSVSGNVSWQPPAPAAMPSESFEWLRTAGPAEFPLPERRDELPGAADAWPGIVERFKTMWQADPGVSLADLATLTQPVLFVAADRNLVRTEHTVAMFEATPDAWLSIIAGANHFVPQTHAAEVAAVIERFFAERPASRSDTSTAG